MNRDEIRGHITSHTFINILSNIFKVVVSGFVLVYVARILGPSQYGIVSVCLSVAVIVGLFCDFGVSTSTAKHLAESDEPNQPFYINGRILNFIFSLAFSVLLFLLAKPVSEFVNLESPNYIYIVCVMIFFTGLSRYSIRCLQGIKLTNKVALLNFFESLFANIALLVIVYLGFRAEGVLVGHTIPWIAVWVLSLFILNKYLNVFSFTYDRSFLKKIFFYALPLLVTSSSYFLLVRGPVILLSAFHEAKDVSYLGIPLRIIEIITLPAFSLSVVATPFFTKYRQKNGDLSWLYVKISKYFLVFYIPIAAFLAISSHRLITTVFGLEYSPAASVLLILSFYLPFFAFTNFSGTTLDFLGYAKQKSIVFAIITIIAIAASLYFVPLIKEKGAALVIAVPYTFFSIYTILVSSVKCNVTLHKYAGKVVKYIVIVIGACILSFYILHTYTGIIGLLGSFFSFVIVIFLSGVIFHIFKPAEFLSILHMTR